MDPRDYAQLILIGLGINLVFLAFYFIKLDFPLNFVIAGITLLLGLAALSAVF